jgi:hypothetical protein
MRLLSLPPGILVEQMSRQQDATATKQPKNWHRILNGQHPLMPWRARKAYKKAGNKYAEGKSNSPNR